MQNPAAELAKDCILLGHAIWSRHALQHTMPQWKFHTTQKPARATFNRQQSHSGTTSYPESKHAEQQSGLEEASWGVLAAIQRSTSKLPPAGSQQQDTAWVRQSNASVETKRVSSPSASALCASNFAATSDSTLSCFCSDLTRSCKVHQAKFGSTLLQSHMLELKVVWSCACEGPCQSL